MPFQGQAIFTNSQLDEINRRIDNQDTDYWSSGNGFFGDGLQLLLEQKHSFQKNLLETGLMNMIGEQPPTTQAK